MRRRMVEELRSKERDAEIAEASGKRKGHCDKCHKYIGSGSASHRIKCKGDIMIDAYMLSKLHSNEGSESGALSRKIIEWVQKSRADIISIVED